jgi:hypothetical protein
VTRTGGHGANVQCDISGDPKYVASNAIFLPTNEGDFEISFKLDPASGLSWDGRAFCADVGKCPHGPAQDPGHPKGQFTASAPAGETLTVHAAGQGKRSVAHYRLDFAGGDSCDPIIINI